MYHWNILPALTKRFVNSLSASEQKYHLQHSDAVSLLPANPYFAESDTPYIIVMVSEMFDYDNLDYSEINVWHSILNHY